jgi:hypothetical protein
MGVVCVSLGSIIVQLHDSLGSRRTYAKALSIANMATVLEECTIEEQRPVVRFLWAKGLNSKEK